MHNENKQTDNCDNTTEKFLSRQIFALTSDCSLLMPRSVVFMSQCHEGVCLCSFFAFLIKLRRQMRQFKVSDSNRCFMTHYKHPCGAQKLNKIRIQTFTPVGDAERELLIRLLSKSPTTLLKHLSSGFD